MSWEPAARDGEAIHGYVVTVYNGYWPALSVTFNAPKTTQTIGGLTNGVTYRFKVAGFNAVGTGATSRLSNPVVPTSSTRSLRWPPCPSTNVSQSEKSSMTRCSHGTTSSPRSRSTASPDWRPTRRRVFQVVADELMLDGDSRQNLATFCQTWEEPEVHRLMDLAINKNMDQQGRVSADRRDQAALCAHARRPLERARGGEHRRCIDDRVLRGVHVGRHGGQVAVAGPSGPKPRACRPMDRNMVCGPVQVVGHKFAKYWDIEIREVPMSPGHYAMGTPDDMFARVDENTILVVPTLGVTYTGCLRDGPRQRCTNSARHPATGNGPGRRHPCRRGQRGVPWRRSPAPDLRVGLPGCLGSSRSARPGHKFGLAPLGVGWVVWRDLDELPDDLIFHVSYLGGDMPVFQINFSRPAGPDHRPVLRLRPPRPRWLPPRPHGPRMTPARYIADEIAKLGPFKLICNSEPPAGIPTVTWRIKEGRGPRLHAVRPRRPAADTRLAGARVHAHRRRRPTSRCSASSCARGSRRDLAAIAAARHATTPSRTSTSTRRPCR